MRCPKILYCYKCKKLILFYTAKRLQHMQLEPPRNLNLLDSGQNEQEHVLVELSLDTTQVEQKFNIDHTDVFHTVVGAVVPDIA